MSSALSIADSVVILLSLALVVLVGLLASRNQDKTASGYFLASGKLPWYIIGAAFVSTSVSSEQIVGTVGAAYRSGMGIANWEWWSLPVYSLLIIFFIPVLLRNRITTMPDFLSRRFGPLCGHIYSWVMFAAYIVVFLVTVLYSGTLAFSEITGWRFGFVLWLTVILVGTYAVKGGLRSVVWTDALQCVMLVGGGVVLFFFALDKIPGGWHAMEAAHPERFHLYHPVGDPDAPFLGLLMGSVGLFVFYSAANQVMIQRVLGARSAWDGMMGIVFAGFINLVRPLVTCFLGFIVFHWIHVMNEAEPLANSDTAFTFGLRELAPGWGLRGIILAGFLAAVMSTISALANSSATIFSLDIYRRLINRAAGDAQLVRVGRLASVAALVVAALLAPVVRKYSIFLYFQTGVTYVATPFIAVILVGLLWRRANYASALFGLIGGTAIQAALVIGADTLGYNIHRLYLAFAAEVIIILGMIVVALATPPPGESSWKPLVWSRGQLAAYDEGIARPWYHNMWLWFAVFAAAWFFIYWRFW